MSALPSPPRVPASGMKVIVLGEACAAPRLRTVDGLWRSTSKLRSGRKTGFIRSDRLLPSAKIDAIIADAPGELVAFPEGAVEADLRRTSAPRRLADQVQHAGLHRQITQGGRMMTTTTLDRAETIARLNDRARHGLDRTSKTVITRSCLDTFCSGDTASGLLAQAELLRAVRNHRFENDAHGERDFGAFEFRGEKLFFKVDYFDLELTYGSEDPADASQTTRVITIMLASDY